MSSIAAPPFDFGLEIVDRFEDTAVSSTSELATPAPSAKSGTSTPPRDSPSSAGMPARHPSGEVSDAGTEEKEEEAVAEPHLETPEAVTNATTFELPEDLAADPEAVRARNVYVAGLPLDFGASHFTQLLEQFGKIVTCRFIDDNRRAQRAQRAYGFVLFEEASSASAAVEGLNGLPMGEEQLVVRLSENGVVKPPPGPKKRRAKKSTKSAASAECGKPQVPSVGVAPVASAHAFPTHATVPGYPHAHLASRQPPVVPQVVFMPVPMMMMPPPPPYSAFAPALPFGGAH